MFSQEHGVRYLILLFDKQIIDSINIITNALMEVREREKMGKRERQADENIRHIII